MVDQLLADLATQPQRNGVTMTDIIELPTALCGFLRRLTRRRGFTLDELVQETQSNEAEAHLLIEALLTKGLLAVESPPEAAEIQYRVFLIHPRQRERTVNLWDRLGNE